ncbi:hypothetical protein F52700_10375 [Fusarium sp. NRRL 52700]|nr:hypothetical protein F52700_10375 [Fusarium sp. NRRL 52700]
MARTRLQKATTDYFSKLPPEILSSIFAYFCPHCCNEYRWPFGAPSKSKRGEDNTALYNLCLVSQYFRPFAQEVLHHSFDPHYAEWGVPSSWERRLEPFLQTIASRPDLARSVKTVFLKSSLVKSLDFYQGRKAFDACARVLGSSALEVCDKTPNTHASAARQFFLGGAPPPPESIMAAQKLFPIVAGQLLTILLAILPNLGHIRIEKDDLWQVDATPSTLDILGVSSIPLKILETDSAPPNLLARTPKLETLVTSGSENFPNMPCLRNLHIRSTNAVRAPVIEHLLSACTGTLSTFSYTSFDSDIVGVMNLLDKPRFHASLETLHFDMNRKDQQGDHKMPSLKQFTHLKRLFLYTYLLYGPRSCCRENCNVKSLVDTLPSSIISVDLSEQTRTPNVRMRDDMFILSKHVASAFPKLKEIRSNADHICVQYPEASFKSVGVDLIHQDLTICCWTNRVLRLGIIRVLDLEGVWM